MRGEERDADAGVDVDADAADREGVLERRAQPQPGGARRRLVAGLEDDRELVAAEPCERVVVAQQLLQARADLAQHLVAGVVAERVVELLEAVEVDQQQRQLGVVLGPRDRGVQRVDEVAAVPEAGEAVGARLRAAVAQALDHRRPARAFPTRTVADRQAHAHRVEVVELPDREQPECDEHKPKDRAQHRPAKRRPRFAASLAPPHRRYQQRDGRDHHTRAKQRQPGRANQQPPTRPPPAQRQRASNPRRSDNHRSARPERRSQSTGRAPAHPASSSHSRGIVPNRRRTTSPKPTAPRALPTNNHH